MRWPLSPPGGKPEGEEQESTGLRRFGAVLLLGCLAACTPRPIAAPKAERPRAPLALPALLAPGRAGEQRLFFAKNLAPFFAGLARLEGRRAAGPLQVIQLGDSHTANDAFSGRVRQHLQVRFGAAGRGWLPAGVPYKYFRPHLVSVAETGWRHVTPRGSKLPFGLDATIAESRRRGASVTLADTEAAGFDRLAIEFLAMPGGGAFSVAVDGRPPLRIATGAAAERMKRVEIPAPPHAHRMLLASLDERPVRLVGWAVERRAPGIIYENHGTVGATVALLARMSARTLATELADSRPRLIVVAFGTNEGFDDTLDPRRYAADFRARVAALAQLAPGAAILVVGPPDGNRRRRACPPAQPQQMSCRPAAADPCRWHEPPRLAAVRRAQRAAAQRAGWAFWDWRGAMGGACSIDRFAAADPPLAYPEHVHLTDLGYEESAEVLYFDLMRAYAAWKRRGARS